ncbi:MAG TPA: hypothetical protein VF017_23375 [Thermoanaerobaculia bacterium]|nr:hypothetical protein [Thermoanaerobaculia bacterium]
MRQAAFALLVVSLLTPPLWASGPVAGSATAEERPFVVTQRLKAEITGVEGEAALMLKDAEGRNFRVALDESIRLVAQDKKRFDGRKKLRPADLAAGQQVQVLYRVEPFQVLEIKVLKEKAA